MSDLPVSYILSYILSDIIFHIILPNKMEVDQASTTRTAVCEKRNLASAEELDQYYFQVFLKTQYGKQRK